MDNREGVEEKDMTPNKMQSHSGGRDLSFKRQSLFPLQEKVERLSHVIFFLTGKLETRGMTADVLEEVALKNVAASAHFLTSKDGKDDLVAGLLEMTSLVRLASTQKLFTEGSAQVLAGEIERTIERVMRMGELPSVSIEDVRVDEEIAAPETRLAASLRELFSPKTEARQGTVIKDTSRTSRSTKQARNQHQKSVSIMGREEQILSIVREKGSVSIKDISKVIRDCSEKTLQRTLIALVQRGALLKEGERRWSTYRIA